MSNIGTFVMITIGGKLLVGQNSASLKDTITMIEISNKTSGNSSYFVGGRSNTTLSVGGIASTSKELTKIGYHELRSAALSRTSLSIVLAEFTDQNGTVELTGTERYSGNALASSVSWENPDNDKQTFSCDLQVNGDLVPATSPGTVSPPTGATAQILATGSTVANLVAVGLLVEWFAASTGGSALAASTALVSGSHYYAEQTIGGVKSSTRLNVQVALV